MKRSKEKASDDESLSLTRKLKLSEMNREIVVKTEPVQKPVQSQEDNVRTTFIESYFGDFEHIFVT